MLLPIIIWHPTHHSHTSSLTPSKNDVVHSYFQSFSLRHTNNTITIIIFLIQVKYILVFCHTKNKKKTNLQVLISEDIYAFHIWYVMFFSNDIISKNNMRKEKWRFNEVPRCVVKETFRLCHILIYIFVFKESFCSSEFYDIDRKDFSPF